MTYASLRPLNSDVINIMSIDRLIHLVAGIVIFILFVKLSNIRVTKRIMLYAFISMAIGTWVSDWDLILGIGFHRSPITHSLLPAILVGWLAFKIKTHSMVVIGFCLGLSSHLFWDIVVYGNVQWISGGNNDRLFLFINGSILIAASLIINKKFIINRST